MSRGPEQAQARAAWMFLAPSLSLIAIFFVLPVLFGLFLSLTDFDLYAIGDPSTVRFVGLRNFAQLASDPLFWKAIGNTFYFVGLGGPLSVITSLVAALAVNSRLTRMQGVFRVVFFVPYVTTLVAVAIVWRYLYHPHYGLLNWLLGALHVPPVDWLGDPHRAMPAIVLVAVWKNFGYNMLVFIAGLQAIPEEQYEAARLEGAGPWQQFAHVTVPGLAPTFLFVGVITMLGFFQLFSEPYVMTQGGPLQSTTTVVLLMYQQGFRWWRMGMSSAIAVVLLVIMLVGTIVQMRLQRESRT